MAAVRHYLGITGTGPSSPHPGVDTGAYATPLVACTGTGARRTDGRDRGGYMQSARALQL